jgi:hypothetical protein
MNASQRRGNNMANRIPKPPLHPFSALAVIAIDAASTVAEFGATATVVGVVVVPVLIILSGVMSFLVVALIERQVAARARGGALAAGAVMGLLTAFPYVFAGGVAGVAALAWAGLYESGNH